MKYGELVLPEVIDASESREYRDFYHHSEKNPLFARTPEQYFSEKLGPDWPAIFRMEKEVLSHHKKHGPFAPGCHEIKLAGREGELYVFDVHSYYDAGDGDHGPMDGKYKVRLTGKEIRILTDEDLERERHPVTSRVGKASKSILRFIFSS